MELNLGASSGGQFSLHYVMLMEAMTLRYMDNLLLMICDFCIFPFTYMCVEQFYGSLCIPNHLVRISLDWKKITN